MNITDLRQIKSQEKLQNAYLTLLDQGFEQLSIIQICKEAKVTRPTFYKQFADIQQLRLSLHESLISDLRAALTIENPKPLVELTLHEMNRPVCELFEHIQKNSNAFKTLLIQAPDALFSNQLKQYIKRFIEDGTRYSQVFNELSQQTLDFLLAFYTGAYMEAVIWWIQNDYPLTPSEMAKSVVETAMFGSIKDSILNKSHPNLHEHHSSEQN